DDVAGLQGGDEDLLDVGPEALAVDRAVENPWRRDAVVAQGGQEGRGPPPAVRDLGVEPHAAGRPSPQRRHVGLGPGLVDDGQARCSPAIALGLCPPILPGATLPVRRSRRTQLITVLMPTPNCAAARRRDIPLFSTAATTRSRRSRE